MKNQVLPRGIGNSARNPVQSSGKAQRYQPEYQRLGVEPVVRNVNARDFSYGKVSRRNQTISSFHSNNEPPRLPMLPKQVRVASGVREHTWYPSEADAQEQAEVQARASFNYDEVEVPQELLAEEEDEQELPDWQNQQTGSRNESRQGPSNGIDLNQIPSKWYAIVLEQEILHVAEGLEEIEEIMEKLLFDNQGTQGLSIENFSVFQRLDLKFGIVIKK